MSGERFYEAPAVGGRRSAPAALRNREPIAKVLREWLPASGLVLEIASGTGEHAVYFAERLPGLIWQPSDIHPDALASIRAWREESGLPNIREPLVVDASSPDWPIDRADALLSINMVHISPWRSALGLIEGAARILPGGAPFMLYGPWLRDDVRPRRATLRSTLSSSAAIRDGGYAASKISPLPPGNASSLSKLMRCRRTI